MSGFNVRLDISDLETGIAFLKDHYPNGIRRALERARTAAAVVMGREVAKDLGINQGAVRGQFVMVESTDGQSVSITLTGKRIPLIQFKARGPEPSRGRGKGVSYRLPGGRGRIENAFITSVGVGGHRGIFTRTPGRGRLPIQEKFGPSLPHVFAKYAPQGLTRGQEVLVKNLQSEARFALRRQ